MIKFVDEDMFNKLYKKFSIYANNKFLIALKYRDFKFYLRDLSEVFNMLFSGLFFLITAYNTEIKDGGYLENGSLESLKLKLKMRNENR